MPVVCLSRRAEFSVKLKALRITSEEKIVPIFIAYSCVVPSFRNSAIIISAVLYCLGSASCMFVWSVRLIIWESRESEDNKTCLLSWPLIFRVNRIVGFIISSVELIENCP